MIGMGVGEQHGVDPPHPSVKELLAQIWRGVDEQRRPTLLHQHRDPAAAVARIGGIALPPLIADAWNAPGRTAAKHGHAHHIPSGGRALANSRKKFSLVTRAIAS